jgi:hypothetical protein
MLAISATFSALLLAAGAGRTSSPHAWRTSGRAYLCSTYTQADFSVLFFFLLVHTALSVRCLAAALCNFCALPFMYDAHDAVADVGCATRRRYLWRNHSNVNAAHLAHKGVLLKCGHRRVCAQQLSDVLARSLCHPPLRVGVVLQVQVLAWVVLLLCKVGPPILLIISEGCQHSSLTVSQVLASDQDRHPTTRYYSGSVTLSNLYRAIHMTEVKKGFEQFTKTKGGTPRTRDELGRPARLVMAEVPLATLQLPQLLLRAKVPRGDVHCFGVVHSAELVVRGAHFVAWHEPAPDVHGMAIIACMMRKTVSILSRHLQLAGPACVLQMSPRCASLHCKLHTSAAVRHEIGTLHDRFAGAMSWQQKGFFPLSFNQKQSTTPHL